MAKLTPVVRQTVYAVLMASGISTAAVISGTLLTAESEGLVLGTYLDPVGIVTSCYGHTGPELKLGMTFTREQCDAQLAKDLDKHEKQLDRVLKFPVPIYAKAAMIDFTYNVGIGNVASSTLLKKLNVGNVQGACQELTKWVYAQKRKLAGLVKRRDAAYQVCVGNVTLEQEMLKWNKKK